MNYILALALILVLSIGNFIPLRELDFSIIIVKIFLFLAVIFLYLITQKSFKMTKLPFYYFLIVTLIFCEHFFRSMDLIYALDKYISVTLVVLCAYYFFSRIYRNIGFEKTINLIIINGFLILIITIIYKVIFGFWVREIRFFLNGSIVFAWMMSFYSLLSFYLFKTLNRKIYIFLTFVFFLAVLWAESKGPILGYILAILFYLSYQSKFFVKLLLVIGLSILFIFSEKIIDFLDFYLGDTRFGALLRIIKGDVSNQDSGSITIRQDMVSESYNIFYNNFINGIGLGNYQFFTVYDFIYPHNIHIEVFMECGFFVGVLYILFVAFSFYKSIPIIKTLLLLFFVCGCFSGDITYLRFLIFICLIGLFLNKMRTYNPRVFL